MPKTEDPIHSDRKAGPDMLPWNREPLPLSFVSVDAVSTSDRINWCFLLRISAVRYNNGEQADSFSSVIKPPAAMYKGRYTPPNTYAKYGISEQDVREAPCLYHVLKKFWQFIGNSVLAGYGTDAMAVLWDRFYRHTPVLLSNSFVDIKQISGLIYPDASFDGIRDLARKLKIKKEHNDLSGCCMAGECLIRLADIWNTPNQETLWDIGKFIPEASGENEVCG